MKLICKMSLFPLISTLGLYLISKLVGAVLIRGQRLKEGGAYFKVSKIYHIKFQNFAFVLFNNKNDKKIIKTSMSINPKKSRHQNVDNSSSHTYRFITNGIYY